MFSISLLQAISDWQRDTADRDARARRGHSLKEAAMELPVQFRRADSQCFRQIALDKNFLWTLAVETDLAEATSSWTTSLELAKQFKGGVPPEGDWQGVIWAVLPSASQVVVNLEALFSDPQFRAACEEARKKIAHYEDGIGKYSGSQHEVVLEIERLPLVDGHAMGGYSSNRETMATWFFGPGADASALDKLDELLARSGRNLGPSAPCKGGDFQWVRIPPGSWSLQPVAIGAVVEETKPSEPPV